MTKYTCVVSIGFALAIFPKGKVDVLVSERCKGAVVADPLVTISGKLYQADYLVHAHGLLAQSADVGDIPCKTPFRKMVTMKSFFNLGQGNGQPL